MPPIPTEFEPGPWDESHLTIDDSGEGLFTVTWPLRGLAVVVTKELYPPLAGTQKHTPALRVYGTKGFSLGTYHEFFIEGVENYCAFTLGEAEVTVGQVTPLALYLFECFYDRLMYGDEWGSVSTVRILGVSNERVEAYLLNALRLYGDCYNFDPSICSIEFGEEAEEETEPDPPVGLPRVPVDIEPLRFYYRARQEPDHEAACLQYYRVLEFYAFFDQQSAVAKLRADMKLNDRDFLIEVATKLVARDERVPIIRLVTKLVRTPDLHRAAASGLIPQPTAEALGNALYNFRNSIVHAKYDQRAAILAPSVLEGDRLPHDWRHLLQDLAVRAISTLGRTQG
jgi:hypothetical protein